MDHLGLWESHVHDSGYAGAFQVLPGSSLSPHIDTTQSKIPGSGFPSTFHRTHNCILYLTDHEMDDAPLELWDEDGPVHIIRAIRNRLVIFPMSATSWHGHTLPAQKRRLSLACNLATPRPRGTGHEVKGGRWWIDR